MQDEKYMATLKVLGQNVKRYMKEKSIDFNELSKRTGIRKRYLKKITEGNCSGIMISQIFFLAKGLKINPHELVEGC